VNSGDTVPIRLFLGGFDLTPTFRDVNKKFSVRYYLNLVLIDEENRLQATGMWLPVSFSFGGTQLVRFCRKLPCSEYQRRVFFSYLGLSSLIILCLELEAVASSVQLVFITSQRIMLQSTSEKVSLELR
jgi:hypothetical protein